VDIPDRLGVKYAPPKMAERDPSEMLTEEIHVTSPQTQPMPRSVQTPCEDFLSGQGRILQMIVANKPLSDILDSLVKLIERESDGMLCSVLLLSDDGNHVRHGAAPSLPDVYVKAIDGEPIGPKHGSCGTAMYRGERVVVEDILKDPLWEDYRKLALAAELRACWSTPILSGRGKVLGSFAMYYREPRAPTGDEAGLTEVATRIAGLAIEHQTAREVLARTQAELAAVRKTPA
jgi:GAF domain-containing protein